MYCNGKCDLVGFKWDDADLVQPNSVNRMDVKMDVHKRN